MNYDGRFVWHELMTTDVAAAVDFYTHVAGWTTQTMPMGDFDYTMWLNPRGRAIGGVMTLPEEVRAHGAPPHWMGSVAVADVDATLARAQALGGQVMVPAMDIPDVGRYAALTDPQGAAVSIFHSDQSGPSDAEKGPGDITWNELGTTDYEAALAFYGELFGWEKMEAHDMGPMGIYQIYGVRGTMLGGAFNKSDDMPGPPTFVYYITVADLAAAVAAARERGATILFDDHEVPGGDRIAQLLDPQGAYVALHWQKPA